MANVRRYLASGLTRLGLIPYSELDLANQIQTADLQAGSVTSGKLASGAVGAGQIAAGAVGATELAAGAVGTTQLAADSVTAAKIAAGEVGTSELAAGAVTDAKVASGIAVSKIGGGTDGQVLGHAGGIPTWSDVGTLPPTSATARFPGEVTWHSGTTTPSGWLDCDGSAVSRTTYAALFAAIGTLHGAGDGSTTFNVPDLRDRSPRGPGAAAVGATGGQDSIALATANLPSHGHGLSGVTIDAESAHTHGAGTFAVANAGIIATGTESADHTHSGTTSAAGGHTPTGTLPQNVLVNGTSGSIVSNVQSGAGNWVVVASGPAVSMNAVANHSHTMTTGGRSAAHTHNVPAHGHTFSGVSAAGSAHTHSMSGSTDAVGSGTAVDIKPKHVILKPVVKT